MRDTSLVYIVKDGKVLMLHRIRKKNDENHGKWIGVGGKFEQGECPEDCMRRETFEETGLLIDKYRYCGIVTFQNDEAETEFMHLFLVTEFHSAEDKGSSGADMSGDIRRTAGSTSAGYATREGDLQWLPKDMLTKIPHWAGDRIFLSLIFAAPEAPFFSLKLVYSGGVLTRASLNEHNCLVTDRLILRPFLERDAEALFAQAKDPRIGPAAGWPPHKSPADSLRVIREIFNRPEVYAIVRRDTADPVGAVGLQNFRITDGRGSLVSYYDERKTVSPLCCTLPESSLAGRSEEERGCSLAGRPEEERARSLAGRPEEERARSLAGRSGEGRAEGSGGSFAEDGGVRFEAELGFWLGQEFQGKGLMTEAARAVIRHGFRDLGLSGIWCAYFHGNEPSAALQKRLGFHFHHENEVHVPLPGEVREETVNVMWKDDFQRMEEGGS